MNYKKILVTGAAGFIGHALCKRLIDRGAQVVGIDNINDYYDPQLKLARLQNLGIQLESSLLWNKEVISESNKNFKFFRLNLEDREALPQLFETQEFDAVINLAAQAGVRYSIDHPEVYVDTNIVGFLNILECCRNFKIKHLVYASSSSVYGENAKIPFSESDNVDRPISLYAATKKSNELMAYTYSHLFNIPTSGLRFFTVYGPWARPDMAASLFADAISRDREIKVFNHGDMSRDFTFIDDIVDGVLITLNYPPTSDAVHPFYQLFNIGNGAPVSLKQFIKLIETNMGKTAQKINLPMQPGDVPQTWADITNLSKLGYRSKTGIEQGIKSFVDWFKGYYDV